MTERKPHADNDLHKAVRDTGMERPTGQDNPAEDAMKGEKTIAHLDPAKKGPSSK